MLAKESKGVGCAHSGTLQLPNIQQDTQSHREHARSVQVTKVRAAAETAETVGTRPLDNRERIGRGNEQSKECNSSGD